ncbi:MAG: CotH kinase family protein, partial [Bacteroidales bacterium]|nr:CotH kinase family protein [Bacteroidales bacterium]
MALTSEEIKTIVNQVKEQLKSDSTGVNELKTVTSITGIQSLPSYRKQNNQEEVVLVPITLLAQPALDAANIANAAAAGANAAKDSAEWAVGAAQAARQTALNAASTANMATENVNTAIEEANTALETANKLVEDFNLTVANVSSLLIINDFVEGDIGLMEGSTPFPGDIVYSTYHKKIVFRLPNPGSVPGYYMSWPTRGSYTNPDGTPRSDKGFMCQGSFFLWNGSEMIRQVNILDLINLEEELSRKNPFFNVTERVPLDSGYYTLSNALKAVPAEIRKNGLVITYQIKEDEWETKQFTGNPYQTWKVEEQWEDFGSGSGAGNTFNATAEIPQEEFYTLETALAAVPEKQRRKGLEVTFEAENGKWKSYQFTGTDLSSFFLPSAWAESGGGGTVKKIKVTKGMETTEINPDEAGLIHLEIPVVEVDQSIDKNSTNPISGKAVAVELDQLAGKQGVALQLNEIGEGNDKAYSLPLLNEEGEVLSTSDMFTGGGGGSVVTTKIVLTRLNSNQTVKSGDEVKVAYTYDHIETETGTSTGNMGKAVLTITRGAASNTIETLLATGTTQSTDITRYLGVGTNSVKLRVTVGEGTEMQVASLSWIINVVQLKLTSSFNIASVINRGDVISVPFSVSGSGTKTLRCFIDGVDAEDRSITTSTANGSFSINTANMTHGAHSIQLVCELEVSENNIIKSNSIYYDIAVRESSKTTPIVATRFDYADGAIITGNNRPYVELKQYDNYTLTYAAYNPKKTPAEVEIVSGDKTLSNAQVLFVVSQLTVRTMNYGTESCKIICGNTEYSYNVIASKSDLILNEPTDNLQLKLTAEGRTNNDINKTQWTYGDISTEFSGIKWGGDGWMNNALRLKDEGRAVIQYQPLKQPILNANNAFTFMVKYKVSEALNEEAEVIRCIDDEGTGFVITAQEARMITKGNSSLSMKMAPGEVYEVGFVSYPKGLVNSSDHEKLNSEMIYLYINGIMSGSVQRGTADNIYQDNPQFIEMGANDVTTDIYCIRSYNSYLSDSQMLDCYIMDQDTADDLITKYNENNIVDGNGNISVENVPEDMRYVIVTGKQANGVATVLQAAVMNNKSTKYDVDDILCVKKSQPELNFRLKGGSISLQGTSSLAYPIKNYRIYLRNANKADGMMYLGCDSQGLGGKQQEKAKYSFRAPGNTGKVPAPVNCFCLKADFAESSSSHNTGMARLANDVLVAANELTPAQKYADGSYKYDVRTTIDGEPCLLFYRETLDDTPVFVGKYNFNNDKSTEAVFGFLDIPGYHDQQWVKEKFDGQNPTECWEFLNNDYPMGIFKDDDFDSKDENGVPNWLKVFEARFPDDDSINEQYEAGTKKPTYLQSLVKWVKSTDGNPNKFRNEVAQYFDVNYLCDYFMFTEIFGCVDQRVKNMMFGFWYSPDAGKMLCYPIFYDCDTILGVRNDGRLKYSWDIDENSIDPELSSEGKVVYAYAGHESVLWNNLRTQFADQLKETYKRIRQRMTNEAIFNIFDNEQSSKFCERIYNMDAQYKYVKPKTLGIEVNQNGTVSNIKYSYLEAMQGNRLAHRHWWISNRMNLFDAKYSAGEYTLTDITWKGNSAAGATVKATPSRDFYFEFRREGDIMQHAKVEAGKEWSYTYNQVANVGTIFHLLGGVFMAKLNLSEWGGFTDINFPRLPILKELVLGKDGNSYTLTELVIADKMPLLRSLDMRNYTRIPSLDLTDCPLLEEVNASGCSSLAVITLPEGSLITSLKLPMNYQTLILRSLPYLTREGITLENKANITGLWVDNCKLIDGFALFEELLSAPKSALKYIRVTGLKLQGDGNDLRKWHQLQLGGIDSEGNTVANCCKLSGTYRLTKYMEDDELELYSSYFDELDIIQSEYTIIEFDDSTPDPANISNLDNDTGYKFGNKYEPSSHIKKILSLRHRVLGKKTEEGVISICQLHDKNSNYYADSDSIESATPADLTGIEGNVWVYEPRYWYKGVNDILNKKKYAFYSSKETVSFPIGKKILPEEITYYPNWAIRISSTYNTLKEALVIASDMSYALINLEGYKKVRFQSIASVLYGAVFLDEKNNILSRIWASSELGMADGMYLIAEVPQNAVKLAFSVSDKNEKDFIWLTNSINMADIEPDWVLHEECLGGVYNANIEDNIVRTKSGLRPTINIRIDTVRPYIQNMGKGFRVFDYTLYKDIVNLAMVKYGTRDTTFGFSRNYAKLNGVTNSCGMVDTIELINPNTNINVDADNSLGYESLLGNQCYMVEGLKILSRNYIFSNRDGSEKIQPIPPVVQEYTENWIQRILFSKDMDIIPVQVGGSATTYYPDTFFYRSNNTQAVIYGMGRTFSNNGWGLFFNCQDWDGLH